jgi:hypothetical protein
MIQLGSYNSLLLLKLHFTDESGVDYVPPSTITWTLLALKDTKESWVVVNDRWEVDVSPASQVSIPLAGDDMAQVDGCLLQRKVIVKWQQSVNGQYFACEDEVNFEVKPQIVIEGH